MDKITTETVRKKNWFSDVPPFVIPSLTFIAGCIVSIAAFFIVQSWVITETRISFEFNAKTRLSALQTDVIRHQEIVNSIAGLFSSSQNVTRDEFQDFVKDILARYPYIQGLSWNPLITDDERKRFVQKARDDGFTGFDITELDSEGKIASAASRDDYVAVYYIEPLAGNQAAMGFNIASNPQRLQAIEMARDTGKAIITERIRLVQEQQDRYGYLLLKAIYRKGSQLASLEDRRENFAGLAVGVFRFNDWIPLTITNQPPLGLDLWIHDVSAPAEEQFLHFYSSRTREQPFQPTQQDFMNAQQGLHWKTTIDVSGRQWSFVFAPSPAFLEQHKSWQAELALGLGLLITILLSTYLFTNAAISMKLAVTNRELLNALHEIKTLKGIIPICSYCHCIRNDEGAWDRLESYLSKHSDASFSHGICPDCMEKVRSEQLLNVPPEE